MFYIYVSTMHVCGVVGGLYPGFVRTAQLQHVQCTLWWDWRPANEPCPALLAVKERVEENRRVHNKAINNHSAWLLKWIMRWITQFHVYAQISFIPLRCALKHG